MTGPAKPADDDAATADYLAELMGSRPIARAADRIIELLIEAGALDTETAPDTAPEG